MTFPSDASDDALSTVRRTEAGAAVAFARTVRADFDDAIVLADGSAVAADAFSAIFAQVEGYPRLHVLDTIDPASVRALEADIDIARTLFVVSASTDTAFEPQALFRYFFERVGAAIGVLAAPSRFVAVTTPRTRIELEARIIGFRHVFVAGPGNGRRDALSWFGIVPAALAGYDIAEIVERAAHVDSAAAVRLGTRLGALARAGRDKLTIVAHPRVAGLGAWIGNVVAGSTEKGGVGIVPVVGEPLGSAAVYGPDRAFVFVGDGLPDAPPAFATVLDELAAAGNSVLRLTMRDALDIGAQFALWQIAATAAAAALGVDPLERPDVRESVEIARHVLATSVGGFDIPRVALMTPRVAVTKLSGSGALDLGPTLASALGALLRSVTAGDYVAIDAFLPMFDAHVRTLTSVRRVLRDALAIATTIGCGPRLPNGLVILLTANPTVALHVPGSVRFDSLERAQALGDFIALDRRGRRGLRIHLHGDVATGLRDLATAVDEAVSSYAG